MTAAVLGPAPEAGFLAAEGEMAARIRAHDWTGSALGAPEHWSPSLKAMVRMALTTRHPIFIFWGPQALCFYNDAYSNSLGPEKHPSILGQPAQAAWPEIWHIIGPQIQLVMRGEGATWYENQLVPILRHGAVQQVYWTYSYGPIDDAAAAAGVGGVLVVCSETTAQVAAERRLTLEHQRFAQLFEQSPSFMAVLRGPQHVFELTNPAYMRLIGNLPVLGRPVAEALPAAVEQGYLELLDRVYASGQAFNAAGARYVAPVPDGGPPMERFLDFVYQPMKNAEGAVTGIFVEGNDVTHRTLVTEALRQAEAELRRSEEQLRLATDAGEIGLWDVDLLTDTLYWQPRVKAMFGVSAGAAVSMDDFHAGLHPGDQGWVSAALGAAIDPAQRAVYDTEYRTVGKEDGVLRWVAAKGRGVFNDEGRCVRVLGTAIDISRRKAIEALLQESDRKKDEFLATLAHELRNPLAPLRSGVEVLQRDGRDAAAVARVSALMDRQLRQLVRLTDDLLDVSRINTGKLTLHRQQLSLATLLQQAAEACAPIVAQAQQTLQLVLPPEELLVHGDLARLTQALGNLIGNASKFMPDGGEIRVAAQADGGDALITVRDFGIGIDRDDLHAIFEPFTQLHAPPGAFSSGLGIGLALVRQLVSLHGGSVEARSEGAGRGSEFSVRLPLQQVHATAGGKRSAAAAAPAPMAETGDAAPAQSVLRVLVVDDNRDAAELLAMLLQMLGHEAAVCFDGLAAVEQAQVLQPQVVFLDIGMPGLDGYEVCRRLRAQPWARATRIVAVTGWGQPDDRRRSAEAGFDAHLVKPASVDDVQSALSAKGAGGS